MKKEIKKRLLDGKHLTKKQLEWATDHIPNYDDGCQCCALNLCFVVGVPVKKAFKIVDKLA